MNSTRIFVSLSVGLILFGGLLAYGFGNGWFENAPIVSRTIADEPEVSPSTAGKIRSNKSQSKSAVGAGETESKVAGGASLKSRNDVHARSKKTVTLQINPLPFTGFPEAVNSDANPSTKSLKQDLDDPKHRAAATSTYAKIEKFDPVEYQKDPQTYLAKIRPARVYESAQPQDGVQPLKSDSKLLNQVIRGESVLLRAEGQPGAPITFHTNQVASFENQLKTISIAFDENGIASATLKTGAGSRDLVTVLAASPVHSGQLKYVVRVLVPETKK